MSESIPYNYRCPNLECRAEYVAVQRTYEGGPERGNGRRDPDMCRGRDRFPRHEAGQGRVTRGDNRPRWGTALHGSEPGLSWNSAQSRR